MSTFQLMSPDSWVALDFFCAHLCKLSHALGGIILHSLESLESCQETFSEHPGVLNLAEEFTALLS